MAECAALVASVDPHTHFAPATACPVCYSVPFRRAQSVTLPSRLSAAHFSFDGACVIGAGDADELLKLIFVDRLFFSVFFFCVFVSCARFFCSLRRRLPNGTVHIQVNVINKLNARGNDKCREISLVFWPLSVGVALRSPIFLWLACRRATITIGAEKR